ncbi:MAG: Stp1/IreP family PP2C-type Ser/Thr phosphatase [Clostridium sp.]
MKIKQITHVGMVRDINEDSILSFKTDKYYLLIIADGMGGHKAGEVASLLGVESIKFFIENNFDDFEQKGELIRESILIANKNIYERSIALEKLNGMGTTITAVLIVNDNIYIGHVGDSRAYILKDNRFSQITEDHSYINELLKKGAITKEEAQMHPMKNLITRAVGTDKYIVIDVYKGKIDTGDIIIICSDGLTRHVNDEEISSILTNKENSTEYLLDLANSRGGKDNISIIVARKEDHDE